MQGLLFGSLAIALELKRIHVNGKGIRCACGQGQGPKQAGARFKHIDRQAYLKGNAMQRTTGFPILLISEDAQVVIRCIDKKKIFVNLLKNVVIAVACF